MTTRQSSSRYRSAPEFVATELKRLIVSRQLPPGASLDQAEIARRFAVSRIPVRQALAQLAERGFVRLRRNQTAVVPPLSRSDALHLYQLRNWLERFALELATPRMSREDLARLEELAEAMEEADRAGDVESYVSLNREFHLATYAIAPNPYLVSTLTSLFDLAERYHRTYLYASGMLAESVADHRVMLGCLRAGDVDGLLDAATRHNERTLERLLEDFEEPEGTREA